MTTFIVNLQEEIISGNILIQFADHLAQFLSINKKINKTPPSEIHRCDFYNFDEQAFKEDTSKQEWNNNNLQGTNEKFDDFLCRIENCINTHAPFKKLNRKKIRKITKPWINNYIINMISHKPS